MLLCRPITVVNGLLFRSLYLHPISSLFCAGLRLPVFPEPLSCVPPCSVVLSLLPVTSASQMPPHSRRLRLTSSPIQPPNDSISGTAVAVYEHGWQGISAQPSSRLPHGVAVSASCPVRRLAQPCTRKAGGASTRSDFLGARSAARPQSGHGLVYSAYLTAVHNCR